MAPKGGGVSINVEDEPGSLCVRMGTRLRRERARSQLDFDLKGLQCRPQLFRVGHQFGERLAQFDGAPLQSIRREEILKVGGDEKQGRNIHHFIRILCRN